MSFRRHHARVHVDRLGELRLLESSESFFVLGELFRQYFDRHIPAKLSVSCAIDLTNPPLPMASRIS